uniref:Uncharacterized protein n=1 Tax=Brassica oleracea var. oleracea TaxID=109376 RepID=A0A0D3CZ85_BRAOL
MDIPELPRRIHTLGEEPPAVHSISYHTCWTLHTALKKALHDDEYEELDIKKKYELWSLVGPEPEMLGVHVEAGPSTQEIIAAFERCEGWSRDDRKRLAYLAIFTGYIEGRKYSTPTRVSLARLVMELERFENYPRGRVMFKVLMDSVKGIDISGCYTINGFAQALQVWVYTALPELGANYGNPLPNNPSPPILAYKGRKGRKQFKKAILSQRPWKWTMDCWEITGTWVNTKPAVVSPTKKKVVKEDNPKPQKKARKEASEEAAAEAAAEASEEADAEANEEVTTTVGGLTKEDIKTMLKDIVSPQKGKGGREMFETCLKEIKYLSERVEAVEKKSESVNGTNAGRKSMPEDKCPDVPADSSSSKDKAPEPSLVLLDKNQSTVSDLQKEDARYLEKRDVALALYRAKSDRTRKLAASQQSPYTANSTAKVIIPNKKLYPGYNPFAPIDKKKLKELADWLKTCPHYRTPLDKKPRTMRTWWYQILQTCLEWLADCHINAWINVLRKRYDANPQLFRSERMCFLNHLFAQQWRFNYKDFKDSEPDQNSLGRRLLGGVWNYYAGTIPSFCQSNKVWETDIDDVYAPVNSTLIGLL